MVQLWLFLNFQIMGVCSGFQLYTGNIQTEEYVQLLLFCFITTYAILVIVYNLGTNQNPGNHTNIYIEFLHFQTMLISGAMLLWFTHGQEYFSDIRSLLLQFVHF